MLNTIVGFCAESYKDVIAWSSVSEKEESPR